MLRGQTNYLKCLHIHKSTIRLSYWATFIKFINVWETPKGTFVDPLQNNASGAHHNTPWETHHCTVLAWDLNCAVVISERDAVNIFVRGSSTRRPVPLPERDVLWLSLHHFPFSLPHWPVLAVVVYTSYVKTVWNPRKWVINNKLLKVHSATIVARSLCYCLNTLNSLVPATTPLINSIPWARRTRMQFTTRIEFCPAVMDL
jgi:hypothetical protein